MLPSIILKMRVLLLATVLIMSGIPLKLTRIRKKEFSVLDKTYTSHKVMKHLD